MFIECMFDSRMMWPKKVKQNPNLKPAGAWTQCFLVGHLRYYQLCQHESMYMTLTLDMCQCKHSVLHRFTNLLLALSSSFRNSSFLSHSVTLDGGCFRGANALQQTVSSITRCKYLLHVCTGLPVHSTSFYKYCEHAHANLTYINLFTIISHCYYM